MSKFIKLFKRNCRQESERNQSGSRAKGVFFSVLIFIIIFTIGIFYLGQVNKLATLGFRLHELENKAGELERVNRNIELKIISLQSMDRLKSLAEVLNLVKVDKIEYIDKAAELAAMK